MSLVKCSECGAEISSSAPKCPQCGKLNPSKSRSTSAGIIGLVVFVAMLWWLFGGGMKGQVNQTMQGIEDKVASDAVAQYNIAASQGDKMQKCVQAGMVSAAFLQAKDSSSYNVWKATEAADCALAGVPH